MTQSGKERAGPSPSLGDWAGFGAMCLGTFMAILDIQVVVTSLPTIQAALKMRPDQMSWIQMSYLIAEVIVIPLTGFLTRTLTMRWLAATSLAIFTAASIGPRLLWRRHNPLCRHHRRLPPVPQRVLTYR